MILSRTSQYALRAVLHLARQPEGRLARANDIADALGVPANYLSKILHAMARTGLLVSERGPAGGFRLSRPAEAIPLAEVVAVFDELGAGQRCLLGRSRCLDSSPCAAHVRWRDVADGVMSFFDETTVADLLTPGAPPTPEPVAAGGRSGRIA